jgi:hypothetical protein
MNDRPSTRDLVLVPALITLAVTVLRLVGELQRWSPRFFNREAGGPGSLVGIVWLVPVFGVYFALKLARSGQGPLSLGRAIGAVAAAFVVFVVTVAATIALKVPPRISLLVVAVAAPILIWIVYRGWPALGRTLLAYGLAARIPVVIVMLIAIHAHWGTHYELGAPGMPEMADLTKWFWIGLMPQMTFWLTFTVMVGGLFGTIAAAFVRPREAA